MYKITTEESPSIASELSQSLDELAREGARRMIAEALQLEVEEYVSKLRHLRDERGYALVVRNGRAQERAVQLGVGPVEIRVPRVHDRRSGTSADFPEEGARFTSRTPSACRRTCAVHYD